LTAPRAAPAQGAGRSASARLWKGRYYFKHLRSIALLHLLLLCFALTPAARGAAGEERPYALAVAYLYNFTRFIQWPEAPPGQPFVIAVIGDPRMEAHLRLLEREGRRAGGRRIEIRGYASADEIAPSEVLFVGAAAEDRLGAIVRRMAGKPTLLIGDTPGYAGRGVAIELFRKPDILGETERLRFRIDPKALKDRGLLVSAQLYDVAEVIE
jgi:hypothetical protein